MIRILFYLAIVLALGLGFAWLADRPGQMVVTLDGYQYTVTLMVAAVAVVAVVAAVMIAWWLVKGVWNSPQTISRYFRVRRRDRGYQALSTGMIAAGAGDGAEARRLKKQAMKLISSDTEPLLHLLDAQASLLEGDHAGAREKFETMLGDPEMRLLGLRGLFLEAERLGDRRAAYHYAEQAADIAPQLSWASSATLEARTGACDWDAALRLLDTQKSTRQIERDTANRRRAVLLTAKAMDLIDADPLAAKNAATEANRLAPDLVPAAIIAARALFRHDDLKRGAKVLEAAWRQTAHPDIADAYVHARPGDSTYDRLLRARKLLSQRQNNAEATLAVARAALAAGEHQEARSLAETAIRIQPSEGAYLLLADVEEADTADQGRIRHWLSKAVKAPPDAAWVADGVVSERWAPVSPVTGRIDAFEWKVPVERLGGLIEQEDEDEPAMATTQPPLLERQADLVAPVEATPAVPVEPIPAAARPPAPQIVLPAEPAAEKPAPADEAEPPPAPKPVAAEKPKPAPDRLADVGAGRPPANGAPAPAPFVVPDDPGVDPEESDPDASPRRFRLF